jgi:hypothetical protein
MSERLAWDHPYSRWANSVIADLHLQRHAILTARQVPYAVLVDPERVPEGVIGGTILGLPIQAGDVTKPTVTVEERIR